MFYYFMASFVFPFFVIWIAADDTFVIFKDKANEVTCSKNNIDASNY